MCVVFGFFLAGGGWVGDGFISIVTTQKLFMFMFRFSATGLGWGCQKYGY